MRLALDFQPNAVHSGIYTAIRDGADERHGVNLEVRVPSASTDSLKLLSAGRADMAVVDIHDLALARERGEDLVGVGALVQRPLAAVIARSGIRRPRDLEGRRVGVTGLPSDDAVLKAVVTSDGGDVSRVRRVTIGFSAVPSLVTGRVDAALAFWNAEGVTLRRRGVRTREFRVDRYGAPPYPELVLAVTRRTLNERRDLVRETLAALADGTEEALSHPPTAVGEIARASGEDEADGGRPAAGPHPRAAPARCRLDPAVLREWARFDVRFGILERPPDLRRAFDTRLARREIPARSPLGGGEGVHQRRGLARHARARHHALHAGLLRPAAHVLLHVGVEGQRGQSRGGGGGQALVHVGGEVHHLHVRGLARGHHLVSGQRRRRRGASTRTEGRDRSGPPAPRATAPGGGGTPRAPTRAGPTSA